MKTSLLKTLLFAAGLFVGTASMMADEISATLEHTAGTRFGSAASEANTVDGETEYYNNDGSTGWVGYAFAEFSFAIPEGQAVQSATLTWTATSSTKSKTRDNKLYYLTPNTKLNYDSIASVQALYNYGSTRTYISNTTSKKKEAHTTDVTSAVKTINTAGQNFIVFQWTGNVESGKLEGKASADAPTLVITTVDASQMTSYTVKFVDEDGNELKTAVSYDALIGDQITASSTDMASFLSADNTKKYIYVSGNETLDAVKDAATNVITLVFREAGVWNYSFNAVDADGNVLKEGIVKGSNFEGETFNVGYPYALNIDSTLYTTTKQSSDGKGYYVSYTLSADNAVKNITYTASTTTGIAYLSEAEDIDGLTKTSNNNTGIRSSNGASAYAADADVEFVKLPAGKYKLTTVICDATKNAGSTWNFIADNDTIFTFTASSVNWAQGTSDEFTITKETGIKLAKGGNANRGVDLIYIQRTGDYVAPEIVIEHFADLKDVADGSEVTIKTTDAVITVTGLTASGMAVFAQDATGAVKLDGDMGMALSGMGLGAGSKVMGTIYATYTVANGTPTLGLAEKTGYSTITTGDSIVAPVEMTVADVKLASNLSKYVVVKDAKMFGDINEMLYIVQGNDTVQVYDQFWALPEDFTTPASIESIKGVIVLHKGAKTIYPYTTDADADPAVVAKGEVVPQAFEAANIAALKDAEIMTDVKLMLTDAKVTICQKSGRSYTAYVEDATGALEFGDVAQTLELAAGMTLNGYIYATYDFNDGCMYLMASDKTEESELTKTEGTVTPMATTIAGVKKEENISRYVSFKNASMVLDTDANVIYMIQGSDSIIIYDAFDALPVDEEGNTVIPDSVLSSEGIASISDSKYMFMPTNLEVYKPTTTAISSVSAANAADAAVYSINGTLVRKANESLNGLAKGVYIIRGKKVVVK